MKLSKETEEKISKLQLIEQNTQNLLIQKQVFQSQLLEIENALKELENTKQNPYKIVGNIMVLSKREDVQKDLKSKKEIIELRIKNIEKQEEKLKKEAKDIQTEVLKEVKK